MDSKEYNLHALGFGKLMGNILSLEFLLRMVLINTDNDPQKQFPEWDRLYELEKGETITLNSFTSDKYFSDVVKNYNSNIRIKEEGLTIDDALIDIRNALAHGLISGADPSPPFNLLHFTKRGGEIKVNLNALMTIDWFNEQIRQVRAAMENVGKALELYKEDTL